jgi:hypothetical protein
VLDSEPLSELVVLYGLVQSEEVKEIVTYLTVVAVEPEHSQICAIVKLLTNLPRHSGPCLNTYSDVPSIMVQFFGGL